MSPSPKAPWLMLIALFVLGFGLGARLDLFEQQPGEAKAFNQGVLAALLGDSRRLFANHFFMKADEYFHSGYYPSIFDNNEAFRTAHMAADAGAMEEKNSGDEHAWMGQPTDWIDRFRRHFIPSSHTHLDGSAGEAPHGGGPAQDNLGESAGGDVREILPWLKLSAEMDPNRVETYVAAAYWLRTRMGQVKEAEAFLRDGLLANPKSYAITFELARIYDENHHDLARARNLYQLALRYWNESQRLASEPDNFMLEQILGQLATLERRAGNKERAIGFLQELKKYSPNPKGIDQLIRDTEAGKPPPQQPGSGGHP
jgi:tetratricopeptide (TPR) repeat protein